MTNGISIIIGENDDMRYEDKIYLKQRHLEKRVQYLQILSITEPELEEIINEWYDNENKDN